MAISNRDPHQPPHQPAKQPPQQPLGQPPGQLTGQQRAQLRLRSIGWALIAALVAGAIGLALAVFYESAVFYEPAVFKNPAVFNDPAVVSGPAVVPHPEFGGDPAVVSAPDVSGDPAVVPHPEFAGGPAVFSAPAVSGEPVVGGGLAGLAGEARLARARGLLDAALRAGGCGFFYGLLAFHLQRVDPDDGHLQAGLVGAVCGLVSLAAPLAGGCTLAGAPLSTVMMVAVSRWLPLWLPLIGSALLLHTAQRQLPVLRP